MPNTSEDLAWQTPLKDLHAARLLFRDLRTKFIAWQTREYDEQLLSYLVDLQETGLPFTKDFSAEPTQIVQIKNLINALYLAEQAFKKLVNLNIKSKETFDWSFIDEAYQASHLLLKIASDFKGVFAEDIAHVASSTSQLLAMLGTYLIPTSRKQQTSNIREAGIFLGRGIKLLKLDPDQDENSMLAFLGFYLPQVPSQIGKLNLTIEQRDSDTLEQRALISQGKMEQLIEQGHALSRSIAKSGISSFSSVWSLLTATNQLIGIWKDTSQEMGPLNKTMQGGVCELMAMIKYELLPTLFAEIDKLEIQLMLKPGRLSRPLMKQIKPWYESLTQWAKYIVEFDKKGEQLLKLENSRFIELRLAPINQHIEKSEKALDLLEPVLKILDTYFPEWKLPEKVNQGGVVNVVTHFMKTLIDPKSAILVAEPLVSFDLSVRAKLKEYFTSLKPYISHLEPQFLAKMDKCLANIADYENPLGTEVLHSIHQLKHYLEQVKTDHQFKIDRNQQLIKSVQERSKIALFPRKTTTSLFNLSEREAFTFQDQISDEVRFTNVDNKEIVENLNRLSRSNAWSLHRWYENRIKDMRQAEEDCTSLLTALQTNTERFKDGSFSSPPYTPCLLLDNLRYHQPGHLYVKIEGATLKYEVLQPLNKNSTLYLTTIEQAIEAGHQGYIWDNVNSKLYYIRPYIVPDSPIIEKIDLNPAAHLKIFVHEYCRAHIGNQINLTPNQVERLITSKSTLLPKAGGYEPGGVIPLEARGYHPGTLHKGSIPLSELNGVLSQLASIEDLKPFLPRLFNEALERGHIQDAFKADCIRFYSSIQPYLRSAFKGKAIDAFDRKVVQSFSGHFYKDTSTSEASVPLPELQSILPKLNEKLKQERIALEEKSNKYKKLAKESRFDNELYLQSLPNIQHREFLPDVAEFMQSIEPIHRQIMDSNKTLFRVNKALKVLRNYHEVPNAKLKAEDYPWFHSIMSEFKDKTIEQVKVHLIQIKRYEVEQIRRNKQIIKSLGGLHKPKLVIPKDVPAETNAFLYFGQSYQPSLMSKDHSPKANQLQIKIENKFLHYQFLHYGKLLTGKIRLKSIHPPLLEFNEHTVVNKNTVTHILLLAYAKRTRQINNNINLVSAEEALDLHFWYETLSETVQSEQEGHSIRDKASRYKLLADKKPEFSIEDTSDSESDDLADRSKYLLKTRDISRSIEDLEHAILHRFDMLNDSLKQKLIPMKGLPYPEVGSQNPYIVTIKSWFNGTYKVGAIKPILLAAPKTAVSKLLSYLLEPQKTTPTIFSDTTPDSVKKLQNPRQVLAIKQLMNLTYYLKQIAGELESIHEDEWDLAYTMHLVISFLYSQDMKLLLNELINDPLLPPIYRDICQKADAIVHALLDETHNYMLEKKSKEGSQELTTESAEYVQIETVINALKMLPERLSSDTDDFTKKHPKLKAEAEKTAGKIQTIIKSFSSSWVVKFQEYTSHPFAKLLAPLSVLRDLKQLLKELGEAYSLLLETRGDLGRLLEETHNKFLRDLNKINTELFAQIILQADEVEFKLGLKPGVLANSLKELFNEFYKGMLSILVPDESQQISLLCDQRIIKNRTARAQKRLDETQNQSKSHQKSLVSVQVLLNGCKAAIKTAATLGSEASEYPFKEQMAHLRGLVKTTLPEIKKALNGSSVYQTSFSTARKAGYKDCFIWDNEISQLYHIDSEGKPNKQNGHALSIKLIPDTKALSEENLDGVIEHIKPFYSPFQITLNVKRPTLVKHRGQYYIYANADGSKDGWKFTPLNHDIVSKMNLDFNKTKSLAVHKKYQELYDEISAKTGWIYSIRLKKPYKAVQFFSKQFPRKVEKSTGAKELSLPDHVYMSENEIREYITTNSDFSLERHGVSTEAGCCLIIMPNVPKNYYELTLPAGYNSYYVQVDGSGYDLDLLASDIITEPDNQQLQIPEINPTLVRLGSKYYVFGNSDGVNWKFTELNSILMSKMNIDFTGKKLEYPLSTNACNHIKSKQGHTSSENSLYFINGIDASITKLPLGAYDLKLLALDVYEEPNAKQLGLKKNKPTLIKLGARYFIYGSQDGLIWGFTELDAKYIEKMNINFSLKELKKPDSTEACRIIAATKGHNPMVPITKYQLLSNNDLGHITSLTGHTCSASFVVNDTFIPQQHDLQQLQSLAIHCKAYYEGLNATSQLAEQTAQEQLDFLCSEQTKQTELKKSLYKELLHKKIDVLSSKDLDLQGYELYLSLDELTLQPNRLYVTIINRTIKYQVLDQLGKRQEGEIPCSKIGWPVNKELQVSEDLMPYLPAILQVLSNNDGPTRPYSLASEYQKALKRSILAEEEMLIQKAINSGDLTDRYLELKKSAFDALHLNKYRKLDKINRAADELRLYLKEAQVIWSTSVSWFESQETIKAKKKILRSIDLITSDPTRTLDSRIEDTSSLLAQPKNLEALINYHQPNANLLVELIQCIYKLLETLGLYTPKIVQLVDTLVNSAEKEIKPPRSFSFFAETTRKKLETRIELLKTDEDPTPKLV